jgi:hypothetical protein
MIEAGNRRCSPMAPTRRCIPKPAHARCSSEARRSMERHIWWNFVASSSERIAQAKRDWAEDRFARVPGDDERIPLPAD